jgi:hypothetical protein
MLTFRFVEVRGPPTDFNISEPNVSTFWRPFLRFLSQYQEHDKGRQFGKSPQDSDDINCHTWRLNLPLGKQRPDVFRESRELKGYNGSHKALLNIETISGVTFSPATLSEGVWSGPRLEVYCKHKLWFLLNLTMCLRCYDT